MGYRELGFYERFTAGLGISLPRDVEDDRCLTLGQVMERNQDRPIVLFPEGTKTNGQGVLEYPSSVAKDLIKIKPLHGLKFIYSCKYFQLANTTSTTGLWYLIVLMSQTVNRLHVQYFVHVDKSLAACEN